MNLKTIDAIAAELQGYDPKSLRASDVGLFLERNDNTVYEIEARISWSIHSDLAALDFSDLLFHWDST